MYDDTPTPEDNPPEDQIVLIEVGEKHFIVEGVDYLNQLMLVDGTFPKPVRCVKFADLIDLKEFTGGTANLAELWSIHPEIISRLRKDGHLLEIEAST